MRKIGFLACLLSVVMAGCMARADAASFFKDSFAPLDGQFWYVSNGWADGTWQSCEWRAANVTAQGAMLEMILADDGETQRPYGCAELHTKQFPGYGLYEARMRVVAGSGLNTAFFIYTGPVNHEPWDEIDFEFLGKNTHGVQVNYYTNGKSPGGVFVPFNFDASLEFHNYAIDWQPNKITWYVDGKLIHETPAGAVLPSHPGLLYFSLWSGSAQENAWLGPFNYTHPVSANVEWVGFTAPGSRCLFPQSISCN